MVTECIKYLPVMFLCIFGYMITGVLASTSIDKISFDKTYFINGIVKAVVVSVSVIILAYAFEIVDMSSLGYTPVTVVSTGIVVYATKLLKNIIKLLKLTDKFNLSDEQKQTKIDTINNTKKQ